MQGSRTGRVEKESEKENVTVQDVNRCALVTQIMAIETKCS